MSVDSSYGSYMKELLKMFFATSLTLGLIIGIAMLIFGEMSGSIDLDIDNGALDGLWVIPGLPLVVILIAVMLSPFSFFVYRLLSRNKK